MKKRKMMAAAFGLTAVTAVCAVGCSKDVDRGKKPGIEVRAPGDTNLKAGQDPDAAQKSLDEDKPTPDDVEG